MEYINFDYCGLVKDKLSQENLKQLEDICDNIITDPVYKQKQVFNSMLAGNIENEYELVEKNYNFLNSSIEKLARYYCSLYLTNICSMQIQNTLNFIPESVWVNYQKKYEFNPPHVHSENLSFVIFVKIPYSYAEEKEKGPGSKSNTNYPGHFYYINPYANEIYYLTPESGDILLFDSNLVHGVHPFYTSDDYRITVSGNISFSNFSVNKKITY